MTLEELAREQRPTLPLWPESGTVLGFSRGGSYEAAQRGYIPAIRIGGAWRVQTAKLRELVGLPLMPLTVAAGSYGSAEAA